MGIARGAAVNVFLRARGTAWGAPAGGICVGKVVAGVASRARAVGVPVVALVGSMDEGVERDLLASGLAAALSIINAPMTVEHAMQHAAPLLAAAAERLVRLLAVEV